MFVRLQNFPTLPSNELTFRTAKIYGTIFVFFILLWLPSNTVYLKVITVYLELVAVRGRCCCSLRQNAACKALCIIKCLETGMQWGLACQKAKEGESHNWALWRLLLPPSESCNKWEVVLIGFLLNTSLPVLSCYLLILTSSRCHLSDKPGHRQQTRRIRPLFNNKPKVHIT